MQVKDLEIDDEYITVRDTDSIVEVSKKMKQAGMPDAVVVNSKEKILGALDAYDIVSKVLAEEANPNAVNAKDIMYTPPIVTPDTPIRRVHEIMRELDVSLVPVSNDEEKLLGVVTILDILDALSIEDAKEKSWLGKLRRSFFKRKS